MGLNLKFLSLAVVMTLGGAISANAMTQDERDYYTISKMRIEEIDAEHGSNNIVLEKDTLTQIPYAASAASAAGPVDPFERVGKVISIGKDLVALGEDIYRLVIKGKPSNTTSYAPISVVPRVNGQIVDILETENWTMPVKRTYQVVYENLYGADVATFRYSIFYSYNGSYNGTGAYLTAVQIVPEYVRTLFGFDFTATMKLGGIVNQGTKANPVAGATIIMEYTVSSVLVANNESKTYFLNGKGYFKKY